MQVGMAQGWHMDLRHGAHKKLVNGHEDHAARVCTATLVACRTAADGKGHVHVGSYRQLRQVGWRQNAYDWQPFHQPFAPCVRPPWRVHVGVRVRASALLLVAATREARANRVRDARAAGARKHRSGHSRPAPV